MASGQKGFLLSLQSSDRRDQTKMVFWVVTDGQPVCLVIDNELAVFFLPMSAFQQAEALSSWLTTYCSMLR